MLCRLFKSDLTSPLEVNNVILSLNRITLSDVTRGVSAWMIFFGAFAARNVVVLRCRSRVSVTLSEVGVAAAEARTPHPPRLASNKKKRKSAAGAEGRVKCGMHDRHCRSRRRCHDTEEEAQQDKRKGEATRKTSRS